MVGRIEDYAVIGNCETIALVGRDGAIDWLGLPRFDSAACFAALLGNKENGYWRIAADDKNAQVTRSYRGDTMVLETTFTTSTGQASIIDFMCRREQVSDLVRIVKGISGEVRMKSELGVRFGYGSIVPWVSRQDDGRLQFIAGPDRILLDTNVEMHGEGLTTVGDFTISAGEEKGFVLSWTLSFHPVPAALDTREALCDVERFWTDWAANCAPAGRWSAAVKRSLLTLKALSHWETGGIVAAGTTSLPEWIGSSRNWDYRYCWLRDATFTLYALVNSGYLAEAAAWRQWLVRAVAGNPADLQIMYGVGGERQLDEYEVPWLAGYEKSGPVRIGNAAAGQLQLDVYGEALATLYYARKAGLSDDAATWSLECALISHLEMIWSQPDDGIWEVRGGRKHFTHSKVMAWKAFDSMIRSAEEFSLDAPVEKWRAIRDEIHTQVCKDGFDPHMNSFVQSYGSTALDASLLLIPLVGFLPPSDPRVKGTLDAICRDLLHGGLVMRYKTATGADGLPPGEGAFLPCSFWLADNYALQGRYEEAIALFEQLLSLRSDLGLLAEEYDPAAKRQLGNYPQAFSHLALVNTARNLSQLEDERSKSLSVTEISMVEVI